MTPKLKVAQTKPEPQPTPSLVELNSTFTWTRGADVQKIWRRHGWQPPSEYRNDFLFKVNRETASQ